ncbi:MULTISPECIES: oligosaccharide flippase family protein [Methylomonas]|uniref:oligosaccharide flippase family protein n=1 Tax=Methylomonas TaxID=416 RepID=UPI0022B2A891|nr:oligosaccharide flippase family protein [Methylomonas rhizoryzae]
MSSRALTHFANVLISRLALPLGALLILIVLGRVSTELLGRYALVTTYFFILQTLPLLGLTPYVMREVARKPEYAARYYVSVGLLALISALLINLAIFFGLGFSVYPDDIQAGIRVVGYCIVPGILAFTAEIVLTSLHRTAFISRLALAENFLRVVASIVLVRQGYDVDALMWVLFLTKSLLWLSYLEILSDICPGFLKTLPHGRTLREIFRVVPVFLLNTVLALVISRLDFVVLSLYQSAEVIAHYAIAYRLFEIGMMVITALMTSQFPSLSRRHLQGVSISRAMFRIFLTAFFIVMLPFALGLYFAADGYVQLLFPHQYPLAVPLAQVFMLILPLAGFDCAANFMLNAMDRQRDDTLALLFGSLVYGLALLIWVPEYSIYGAFWALFAALLVQLSARFYFIGRRYHGVLSGFEIVFYLALLIGIWSVVLSRQIPSLTVQVLLVLGLFAALPAILMLSGMIQPLRLLRFLSGTSKRRKQDGDVNSLAGLLRFIGEDARRNVVWRRFKYPLPEDRKHIVNFGFNAVLLYRISRFLLLRGLGRLSFFVWTANKLTTRCDIQPDRKIGPGLVLDAPAVVGISGQVGSHACFMASTAIGRSGPANRHTLDSPVVGDKVLFLPGACILGGFLIADHSVVPPGAKIRSLKDFQAAGLQAKDRSAEAV